MGVPHTKAQLAWLSVLQFFEAGKARFFAIAQGFDLSPLQVHILRGLTPGEWMPMSQTPISPIVDKSTLTRMVDRLVQRGFVQRRENEGDRRVKELALTDEGERLRVALLQKLMEPPPEFSTASDAELEAIARVFSLFAAGQEPGSEPMSCGGDD